MADDQNYQAALAATMNNDTAEVILPEAEVVVETVAEPVAEEVKPEEVQPEVKTEDDVIVSEIVLDAPKEEPKTDFNVSDYLKKELGEDYGDIEVLKTKLNTPSKFEPQFANDKSKEIYEAIVAGNFEPLQEYLNKQSLVASLKDKPAEDIVKAGWKEEYGLTSLEADRRYNKMFSVDEDLDDEDKRIEQKLVAKQVENEADKYKEFFSRYTTEIKLPSAETAPASAPQYVATEEAKQAFSYATELNKTKPADVRNIPFELIDDNFKFQGKVIIPQDELSKIKSGINGFIEQDVLARYLKPDGSFDEDLHAYDVYTRNNLPKIIANAAMDAVHKDRIARMKERKNFAPDNVIKGDFTPSDDEVRREEWRKIWNPDAKQG